MDQLAALRLFIHVAQRGVRLVTVGSMVGEENREPRALRRALSISGIAALGSYREGRSELPEFEPAVVVLSSSTISCTTLLSGSISMIRSGSFTNSSCFASGT